jgi:tetratricopeptide (TPR) repeat protein
VTGLRLARADCPFFQKRILTGWHPLRSTFIPAFVLLLPITLVAAGGLGPEKTSANQAEILRQVQVDILSKRWDEAKAKLDAAKGMEGNAEYHILRAAVLFHGQELTAALREADRAVALDPQQGRYYLLRGQIYQTVRDIEAARRDYQKSIELDPTSAAGVLLMERLLIQQRRPEEALPVLEGAVQRMPKGAVLFFELGRVQEILRRPQDALGSYKQAIALDPKLAAAHVGLGRIYRNDLETLARSG